MKMAAMDFVSVVTTLSLCPLLFALHAAKAISLVRKVRGVRGKGVMYEENGSPLTTGGEDSNEKPVGRQEGAIGGDDGEGARWQKKRVIPESGYRESIGIHLGVVWDGFLEEVRSQNCTRCPVVSLGTSGKRDCRSKP
jgi:hypothetical protein